MLVLVEHYLSMAGIRLVNEDGQGLIEYVLIAALISVAAIAGMQILGPGLGTSFTNVAGDVAIP